MTSISKSSTISRTEITKFEKMAEEWWNPLGKFKPLHELTPVRLEYIVTKTKEALAIKNLKNLKVLDVGCGGGIVSEALSRLECDVTGIDASQINIDIAKKHASISGLNINYKATTVEDLSEQENTKFQLIVALEVIEHVDNIDLFIEKCCSLLAPEGVIIFSTINKTISAFLKAIVAAEYILKWLPLGTHDWNKFLKPSQIIAQTNKYDMNLVDLQGVSYSLLSNNWYLSDDISSNYFLTLKKF